MSLAFDFTNFYTVDVATTLNVDLSKSIDYFTGNKLIDGVFVVTGMNVLLKDQDQASENGVYTLQRNSFLTKKADVPSKSFVFVKSGLVWGSYGFVSSNVNVFSPITNEISFRFDQPLVDNSDGLVSLNFNKDDFSIDPSGQLSVKKAIIPLAQGGTNTDTIKPNLILFSDGDKIVTNDSVEIIEDGIAVKTLRVGDSTLTYKDGNLQFNHNLIDHNGVQYVNKTYIDAKLDEIMQRFNAKINNILTSTNNSIESSETFILNRCSELYQTK